MGDSEALAGEQFNRVHDTAHWLAIQGTALTSGAEEHAVAGEATRQTEAAVPRAPP